MLTPREIAKVAEKHGFRLVSKATLAYLLDISEKTVDRYVAANYLRPAFRLPGRHLRFHVETAISELLEVAQTETAPEGEHLRSGRD